MESRPRLTILVENRVRELDAKLLLAAFAAERGFVVRLGEKRSLLSRLASQPPGVFLNKDVSPRSEARMARVHRLGHVLAAMDEEGLVWFSPQHYFDTKVGAASLRQPELLLAWGEENARVWRAHPAWDGTEIAAVGNPRVDLLRPELRAYWKRDADALLARFGAFVLVNTNFGQLNNRMSRRSGERQSLDAHAHDPGSVAAFELGLARHRQALFESFQEAVGALARAHPDRTLVVRPHPSEDDAVWRRAAAGCENVVVLHEGNATPWLIAARAVVHNGCTTALESHLLGTPAIAFQPVRDDRFDKDLPNGLSHRARPLPELLDRVEAAFEGSLSADTAGAAEQEALLARHVASTTGAFAAERMADALLGLAGASPARTPGRATGAAARLRDLRARATRSAARLGRPALYLERARYYDQVFPQLSSEELRAHLSRLRDALGRFERIELRDCGPNVFELWRST